MPRFYLVELFSGTGSFGRAAEKAVPAGFRFHNHSVDIHPKYNPSSCVDILTWKYKEALSTFLKDRRPSDVVWVHASPPCTEYSRAKTTAPRDLDTADAIVKRTLRIIKFVRPDHFTIENPVGLLQHRPFMQKLERYKKLVSYCRFGKPYRKDTNIWTDVDVELPVCRMGSYCSSKSKYGYHPVNAQLWPNSKTPHVQPAWSVERLYQLPKGLCATLVRAAFTK